MDFSKLKDFYLDKIENDFVPYWIRFIDEEHGGIMNSISNDGTRLLSENKYTWSIGRWLWILSHLYTLRRDGYISSPDLDSLSRWMDQSYSFLVDKSIYGGYECAFLLDREGRILEGDTSIYADCFALIGISRYLLIKGRMDGVIIADKLFDSILDRIERRDFLTQPYPIPKGYEVHAVPMILVNTFDEYSAMKEALGQDRGRSVTASSRCVLYILDDLYDPVRHVIHEHVQEGCDMSNRMLDRHINPGHVLEDAWFWIEHLQRHGGLEENLGKIGSIVKSIFSIGWDKEHGGLFRFVDIDGGMPHGELIGTPYEKLVIDTWDMKLWWPHSESLYIFPLMYSLTGDVEYERLYEKAADYSFTVFPDRKHGEWIQIRQRDGSPVDKVVALPVKDPFHILRDFIKLADLAIKMEHVCPSNGI